MFTTKHGGNLRIFDACPPWQADYADMLGALRIFAENAFGAQYCLAPDDLVVALNPETGDLDVSGATIEEFLDLIDSDPDHAIVQSLYEACCLAHGPIGTDEHFDFIIPLALGGSSTVENVQRLPAEEHMRILAHIARQLKGVPPGTRIRRVLLEG